MSGIVLLLIAGGSVSYGLLACGKACSISATSRHRRHAAGRGTRG